MHKKTVELLEEMKRSGTLKQQLDPETGYYWVTTDLGVTVYLGGKRQGIPAGVVEEALILAGVRSSGGIET